MVSNNWYFKNYRWLIPLTFSFLVLKLIAISANFDPVHKGHGKLIKEAEKKLANKKGKKLVVYLNKGYSANHDHFCKF